MTLAQYSEVAAGEDLDSSVQRFLRAQLRTGGWHPEDDPADQISASTCEPTFTADCAHLVEFDVRAIYAAGLDACGLALAAFPSHMTMPAWADPEGAS